MQERAYAEAMEQLQADLYALEQEHAKFNMALRVCFHRLQIPSRWRWCTIHCVDLPDDHSAFLAEFLEFQKRTKKAWATRFI